MSDFKNYPPLKPYPAWLQKLCNAILSRAGWQLRGEIPRIPQYVMIAAPHTSNWDFLLYLFVTIAAGIRPYFMGKKDLFNGFMGSVMRSLGGLAIDRSGTANVVDQMAQAYQDIPELKILIAPEGTRKHRPYWKSGFYYIALKSGVPVVMVAIHYQEKWCTFSAPYTLTGDQERDLDQIRAFYRNVQGKKPENFSDIRFAEKERTS